MLAAAELKKAWREGYAAGYERGDDDAVAYELGAARHPNTKLRSMEEAWDVSETKAATAPHAGEPCGDYDPAGPGAGVEDDGHPQCANCGYAKRLHGVGGGAGPAKPVEGPLHDLARSICHAVEQRSDDCDMEMHARVCGAIRRWAAAAESEEKPEPGSLHRMVRRPVETFTASQIECAVEQFLEFGEQQYQKSQQGYYSGPGWAARCLRYHLEQLKAGRANDEQEPSAARTEDAVRSGAGSMVPERIWLQWWGDGSAGDEDDGVTSDATWCQDKIFDSDIEYVRVRKGAEPEADVETGESQSGARSATDEAERPSKSESAPDEPAKQVRSGALLGDSPPMTPECESGLWVVWWDDAWSAASCKFVSNNRLSFTILSAKERVSTIGLNAIEVRSMRWGGRLAVNGDSPNDKDQRPRPDPTEQLSGTERNMP